MKKRYGKTHRKATNEALQFGQHVMDAMYRDMRTITDGAEVLPLVSDDTTYDSTSVGAHIARSVYRSILFDVQHLTEHYPEEPEYVVREAVGLSHVRRFTEYRDRLDVERTAQMVLGELSGMYSRYVPQQDESTAFHIVTNGVAIASIWLHNNTIDMIRLTERLGDMTDADTEGEKALDLPPQLQISQLTVLLALHQAVEQTDLPENTPWEWVEPMVSQRCEQLILDGGLWHTARS